MEQNRIQIPEDKAVHMLTVLVELLAIQYGCTLTDIKIERKNDNERL